MEGLSLSLATSFFPPSYSHNYTHSTSPNNKNLFFSLPLRNHYNETNDRLKIYSIRNESNSNVSVSATTKRRDINLLVLLALFSSSSFLSGSSTALAEDSKEQQGEVLTRYIDTKEGFTLLIPSSFRKVEKAGATALFEEVTKGTNNIGVVVTPVRLNTLLEFGDAQFVVDKLIQAEKRKESTKETEVLGVAERLGKGGVQVYEFEYKLDSTRGGLKRIFSAAFVDSKKLYLLNIAYADKPESPLETNTRLMLEQVLHSFDTATSV